MTFPFSRARYSSTAWAVGLAALLVGCIPALGPGPTEFLCQSPNQCDEYDAGLASMDGGIFDSSRPDADASNFPDAAAGDAPRLDVEADAGFRPDALVLPDSGLPRRPIDVAAGGDHTCVLYDDGELECFGSDSAGQSSPPPGPFVLVSAGVDFTCAVGRDGAARCFGSSSGGQLAAPAPAVRYVQISSDAARTCARDSTGAIECWGAVPGSPLHLPGPYDFVALGSNLICTIRFGVDGTGGDAWIASCGDAGGRLYESASAIFLTQVVPVEGLETCQLRDTGEAFCGQIGLASTRLGNLLFSTLAGRNGVVCGVVAPPRPRSVSCYGRDWQAVVESRSGSFLKIAMGWGHSCAIRTDGSVECWGENDDGEATPPPG
ncbi:MAG: hypothetical protein HY791_05845 [Deltaproteobacteria bacterium]|nr:hypothetical protein [Deltaproteobacteria bacterium]